MINRCSKCSVAVHPGVRDPLDASATDEHWIIPIRSFSETTSLGVVTLKSRSDGVILCHTCMALLNEWISIPVTEAEVDPRTEELPL